MCEHARFVCCCPVRLRPGYALLLNPEWSQAKGEIVTQNVHLQRALASFCTLAPDMYATLQHQVGFRLNSGRPPASSGSRLSCAREARSLPNIVRTVSCAASCVLVLTGHRLLLAASDAGQPASSAHALAQICERSRAAKLCHCRGVLARTPIHVLQLWRAALCQSSSHSKVDKGW